MKIDIRSSVPATANLVSFHSQEKARIKGVPAEEFDGKRLTSVLLHETGGSRKLHVGLGDPAKIGANDLRQAAGLATRQFLKIGATALTFELGQWSAQAQAVIEGAILGAYRYETFCMPVDRRRAVLRSITLVVPKKFTTAANKAAHRGQVLGDSTNYVRQIGNTPANIVSPAVLAEEARKLARTAKLKCTVLEEKELKRKGFGGIMAVGQGSKNPPRLIVLEYRGGAKSQKPIALVGKAVTFDSGGISIKPADRMDEMKFDKMGGCAVLGILRAAAELKLKVNLVGVIPSVENMPDAGAYRPGDIVTTYDGKTIEVLNTDAEGRVILADALSYARKHHNPRLMIDMATLTGAVIRALGFYRAGLFTEVEEWREQLVAIGEQTGERLWPLPMGDEYADKIKSDVALVKNTGGPEAGASTAASFLRHWAEKTPWIHLDIAGTGWTTSNLPHLEKGATGFGVRLLVEAIERMG